MAASLTIKVGDTWPVMRLTAADLTGPLSVKEADKIEFTMESAEKTKITGVLKVIDPPQVDAEGEARNLEYVWAAEDTKFAGTYKLEIKITWDEEATPPEVQHVPNTGTASVIIQPSLA